MTMVPSFFSYNIFGPFVLNGFNFFLILALFVFIYLSIKDKNVMSILSKDLYLDLVVNASISAIIFARILFIIAEFRDMQNFWQIFWIWDGGLSSIGAFFGALLYIYYFCKNNNIYLLNLTDKCIIYLPLVQAIGRIGCFFVGCCFGKVTHLPWGIIYTDIYSFAPLYCKLHPAQLYSFIFWILSFIFLKLVIAKTFTKSGQVTFIYIILFAMERFVIDFFRADVQVFIGCLGIYQFFSLIIILLAFGFFSK